jgi:hypothetical protein
MDEQIRINEIERLTTKIESLNPLIAQLEKRRMQELMKNVLYLQRKYLLKRQILLKEIFQ